MTPPESFIRIANQAGLYDALWRPGSIANSAGQLIEPLRAGRNLLLQSPWFWERFGDHAAFLAIVEAHLEACEQHPGRLFNQESVKLASNHPQLAEAEEMPIVPTPSSAVAY